MSEALIASNAAELKEKFEDRKKMGRVEIKKIDEQKGSIQCIVEEIPDIVDFVKERYLVYAENDEKLEEKLSNMRTKEHHPEITDHGKVFTDDEVLCFVTMEYHGKPQ